MTQVFVLYAVAWQRTALTTVTVLLQLQWHSDPLYAAAVRLVQGVNPPSHLPNATPGAAEADTMKWNFIRDTFVIIIPRPQLEL